MKKCRICECKDFDGCATPDGFRAVTPTLCSTCSEMLEYMAAYMMVAGPHDRHTVPAVTEAVTRCLAELVKQFDNASPAAEEPPLIVLAKS